MNRAGRPGEAAPARTPSPARPPARPPAQASGPGPGPAPALVPEDSPDGTLTWQRSSFSGSGGGTECVEAAVTPDGRLHLRESDRPATVLTPSRGVWAAFLRAVRARGGR
ncbi:DUF397 domain-containing protein [Streptomyces albireticuli]|uniref:DUF397 domain-containing protein n=1 Tax=Streptomyces albireticuli TaxID=1940 RepID=UPI00368CFB8E